MYIYQVERDLLEVKVAKYARYVTGRVLDVGAGSSNRYKNFFTNAKGYLRLDVEPDYKPDIVGSADDMPVSDGSFDSIVCTQVLGDLLYPHKVIAEFRRVLRPGGIVLLTEGFMNELHGKPRDYWRFTPFGLQALFESEDFQVVHNELIGGFFTVVEQMLTRFLINWMTLYKRELLGKVMGKFFLISGKLAILMDRVFSMEANKNFGLDIIIIAKKK